MKKFVAKHWINHLGNIIIILTTGLVSQATHADTVNIYTERQQVFLAHILEKFAASTGHKTQVLYLDKGAVPRLKSEGAASPADVVIVVDIGRLEQLVAANLHQPIVSAVVDQAVPAYLRDADNGWVAVTRRLRVLFVADQAAGVPTSIEELAKPWWRGKVCLRSGTHPYNVALFAALLEHHGEAWLVEWLGGLKTNLARKPQGNDRAQIKGVAAGACGVGIANLYYYFKMLSSKDPAERAAAAKVQWLAAGIGIGGGVHVNVSGIVLAKHAPHKQAALEFIEFMVGPQAQEIYATDNSELPVVANTPMPPELAAAAQLPVDDLPLERIAERRGLVSLLVAKSGLDN